MHVPATLAALLLCTLAIVLLRLRWPYVPHKTKRLLIVAAIASTLVLGFSRLASLSTIFDHLNTAVYWAFVLSYIFLLALFTRLKPRWLTTLIAIILVVPLLSASAFLPLAEIFSSQPHRIQALGENFVSDLVPVDALTSGASGSDMNIYRRIAWIPFLQRRYMGTRYFNTQCNSSAAYAVLQPNHRSILMVCPAVPGLPPEEGRSIVLNLYSH
ncbi:MAG: hypothetical protein JWM43_973 [Acidobacteriaceae bacterium]|nr:hypothetical protein [Acidobacteriaceae bacterium]